MALNTADELLTSLLPEWHQLLQGWSADGSLVAAAQEALMLSGEPQALRDLVKKWSAGDFTGLPPIVLLSSADMNGAMGAYAISTATIYVNADWLATASEDQVNAVLTEELGHYLDSKLNQKDTQGDEGEYFSDLLRGVVLTDSQKAGLRAQNDTGAIILGEARADVELASLSWAKVFTDTNTTFDYASDFIGASNSGPVTYVLGYTTAGTNNIFSTQQVYRLITLQRQDGNLLSNVNIDNKDGKRLIEAFQALSNGNLAIGYKTYTNYYSSTTSLEILKSDLTSVLSINLGAGASINGITESSTGDLYVYGTTMQEILGEKYSGGFDGPWGDAFVLKLNALGDTNWLKLYGGTRGEISKKLFLSSSGDPILVGETNGTFSGLSYSEARRNYVALINSQDGAIKNIEVGNDSLVNSLAAYGLSDEIAYINQWDGNNGNYIRNNFPLIYKRVDGFIESNAIFIQDSKFSSAGSLRDPLDPSVVRPFVITGETPSLLVSSDPFEPLVNASAFGSFSLLPVEYSKTASLEYLSGATWRPLIDFEVKSDASTFLARSLVNGHGTFIRAVFSFTSPASEVGWLRSAPVFLPSFITLAVSPASVLEDGTTNLVYTFTRTGATTNALNVNYSIGGTADNSDYTGATPGSGKTITFAAGWSTATLTIDPTADTTIEADETVQLTIAAGTGYTIGTTTVVSGTISNDDPANNAPTDLKLSASSFNENIAAATTIATLGTTDPDSGDTFSYSLVSGTGSTDNAAFSIAGNELKINESPDFETKSSYSIRIRSTDAAGLSFEKVVVLNVNDLLEAASPPQGSANTLSTSGNNSPATSVSNGSGTTIINNITNNIVNNNVNSNNTTTNNISKSVNIASSFNGNTSALSLAGALKLLDPLTNQTAAGSASSAVKALADLTATKPLAEAARKLLDRYTINDPGSTTTRKASDSNAGFIDFTLKTGTLKSLTAEIALASEVKATAYVKVNPNTGEAFDFTYDPVTGLGAELLDTNKNGLVDTLRIHLQDGGLGDVDGTVNGEIRDPGVLADAPRASVYRFYRNGVHFYTTNEAERDNVIKQSYGINTSYSDLSANPQAKDPITGGWGYRFEGVAYQALDTQGTALYRFFSPSKGYHFVTTNAKEALAVIQNSVGTSYDLSNAQGKNLLSNGWGYQFEGTSYKVSTIAQVGMDSPVYRFFNGKKGVHFYSSSMEEAKSVVANSLGSQYATDSWITSTADALKQNSLTSTPAPLANGWGYSFEGVGWYV